MLSAMAHRARVEREVGCVRAVRKVVGGVRGGNLVVEIAAAALGCGVEVEV